MTGYFPVQVLKDKRNFNPLCFSQKPISQKMSIEILRLVFLLFGENFFNWFQPFLFYPTSLSMPPKVLIGKLFFIFLMDALKIEDSFRWK
jgi:hypothetical protein